MLRVLAAALALSLAAAPAAAAVEITFHSKDFGTTIPQAFVVLRGTVDSTGEPVDANYGFTVRHLIGPSVLFGRVEGTIESVGKGFVEHSNRHFNLTLSDAQYREVLDLVERWRALPQPSYSLDRRNCVSFVAEIATLLGLEAETRGLMRRPHAFLDRVRERNSARLAASAPAATPATGLHP